MSGTMTAPPSRATEGQRLAQGQRGDNGGGQGEKTDRGRESRAQDVPCFPNMTSCPRVTRSWQWGPRLSPPEMDPTPEPHGADTSRLCLC